MSHSGVVNHDQSNPDSFLIVVSIVISVIVLFLVCFISYFYYLDTGSEELVAKERTKAPVVLAQLKQDEAKELNFIKWLDKSNQRVQIPIEFAKDIVVKSYNR